MLLILKPSQLLPKGYTLSWAAKIFAYYIYIMEFSGREFKSQSGQLSVATSKNPSVVNTIHIYMRSNKQNPKTCRRAKHCRKSICYLKKLLIFLFSIETVRILISPSTSKMVGCVSPTYKSNILSLQSNYGLFYTFF